jgi:hypothetical protein
MLADDEFKPVPSQFNTGTEGSIWERAKWNYPKRLSGGHYLRAAREPGRN